MISSQETYLLRPISCVEHVVASQKQIADLKGPSLLRKLEKIRKWKKSKKKPAISVTVTYLLNAKTSRSKLSSIAELTWVQAQCQRYMKSLFNTRLLCGETGRFTRRARNRRINARRFFLRSSPHLFLVYFVLFSPVSFFLLSQQLYIRVFSPMMDI